MWSYTGAYCLHAAQTNRAPAASSTQTSIRSDAMSTCTLLIRHGESMPNNIA